MMMARQGRGRRGRPLGIGQAPPVFDQQTCTEAVGITAAAIAQADIAGRQEDPSNLQRLERIILRQSQGEEIRWWQTIGLCRSRRC